MAIYDRCGDYHGIDPLQCAIKDHAIDYVSGEKGMMLRWHTARGGEQYHGGGVICSIAVQNKPRLHAGGCVGRQGNGEIVRVQCVGG